MTRMRRAGYPDAKRAASCHVSRVRLSAALAVFAAAVLPMLAGCDARHAGGTARDTLLQAYSAAESAKPSLTRPLGGVNVWDYCQSVTTAISPR